MSGPRKLVVDGQEYRWLRRRRYHNPYISAWIDGLERATLRIRFEHPDDGPDFRQFIDEYASGVVGSGVRLYNLSRPTVAACLIREARRLGWDPRGRTPLLLDGFALLRDRGFEIAHSPVGNVWLELATQLLERYAAAAGQPPLAWLRTHTQRSWDEIKKGFSYVRVVAVEFCDWADLAVEPALALAGALELGVWLERPSDLTEAQLRELAVWADARQHHGQPGGLALAIWLSGGFLRERAEFDDLRDWCRALLAKVPGPSVIEHDA